MSIVVVQSAQLSNTSTGANSITKAFASAVTPGNSLLCFSGCFGNPTNTFSVSDTVNSSWAAPDFANLSTNHCAVAISRLPVTASGTPSVTATMTGTAGFMMIAVWEVQGLVSSALDQTALADQGTSIAPSAGPTGTTAQASELAVAVCQLTNNASVTLGASSPWTFQNNPGQSMGVEYQILSATGTVSALFSEGSGTAASTTLIATYKGSTSLSSPTNVYYRAPLQFVDESCIQL